MSNKLLFKRSVVVKIGPAIVIDRENFKLTFEVPFDDDTEPNEIKVEVYNLSDTTIANIKKNNVLTIEAGYVSDDTGIICTARVSKVETKISGRDRITTIYALDSNSLDDKQITKKTYAKGTRASYILKDLASQLGVTIGPIKLEDDVIYSSGWTVEGKIVDSMQTVALHCGVSVYINKGTLYIRSLDDGDDAYFVLKSDTGMIGSPEEFHEENEVSEEDQKYISKKARRNIVADSGKMLIQVDGYKCKCLLQHRITTASVIDIKSKYVNGKFRVRKGTHRYTGTEFVTEFECVS